VVVGTYEGLIYGYEGVWDESEQDAQKKELYFDQVFVYSSHVGCVKCLTAKGKYLISGGVDEAIKAYDLKEKKKKLDLCFNILGR